MRVSLLSVVVLARRQRSNCFQSHEQLWPWSLVYVCWKSKVNRLWVQKTTQLWALPKKLCSFQSLAPPPPLYFSHKRCLLKPCSSTPWPPHPSSSSAQPSLPFIHRRLAVSINSSLANAWYQSRCHGCCRRTPPIHLANASASPLAHLLYQSIYLGSRKWQVIDSSCAADRYAANRCTFLAGSRGLWRKWQR